MSGLKIRNMDAADLKRVSEICALAFYGYYGKISLRTIEGLESSLALYPRGCFAAQDDEGISGFIFSRKLGSLGWIGVFGVDPCRHGRDIGKPLLEAAYNELENDGCAMIGLETMPDSLYNVGFYLKYGFDMQHPALVLEKEVKDVETPAGYDWAESACPGDILRIGASVVEGLDYSVEAANAEKFGWGKTYFFKGLAGEGFAILRHVSIIEGQKAESLFVRALVLTREDRNDLLRAAACIERYSQSINLRKVTISASAANANAVRWLIEAGYRVTKTSMRMMRKGSYKLSGGVELSRWIM
ncbi:MAG TPA: GNAT family N-acetyltransferase [Candidatus Wallbacteria bacterium]|nr:GNAT family N-acetyltransferase [Candidatus Wallbacteria bacterium]